MLGLIRAVPAFHGNKALRRLCSTHSAAFAEIIGSSNVLTSQDDVAPYNYDWVEQVEGCSRCVVRPGSSAEVSKLVSYCNQHHIPVVPHGGNTGVSGGCLAMREDEVVLSLARMDKVLNFYPHTGILVSEAGAILENVAKHLDSFGFVVPWDLGARGSCQIGGNLSTSAGGINFIRYGPIAGNVLGVEAVMPDGSIVDSLSLLRKDNTGYNLSNLLIGAEGTLGVITKAAIQCYPRPVESVTAFMGVSSFEKCLEILKTSRKLLSNFLYAFELVDAASLQCLEENMGLSSPLSSRHDFYVMVRVGTTTGTVRDLFEDALSPLLDGDDPVAADCVISESESQELKIWELREAKLVESLTREGHCIMLDLSLPTEKFYDVVYATREHMKPLIQEGVVKKVTGFGHLADGNIHLNVCMPQKDQRTYDLYVLRLSPSFGSKAHLFLPWIYHYTSKLNGSFSAEHGVGWTKKDFLPLRKTPAAIETMKTLKRALDPRGIMNPGKMFDL